MRRFGAAAAIAVALALTPAAASAATFTVISSGDTPLPGTLRSAITQANSTAGSDLIVFANGITTITVNTTLAVTDPVAIDGGGDVTVAQAPTAAGPLLDYAAPARGSQIKAITLAGGPAGTSLVATSAPDMRIEGSTLRDAATSAVSIREGAQRVTVTHNSIYGYGTKAVSLEGPAVNGGIAAPAGLRVGPRQPDGALPITGSTGAGGTLELFRGAQQGFFLDAGHGGGGFALLPPQEPAPGEVVGATITDGAGNTSEYALTRVPDDVVSPGLAGAVANGLDTVDIQLSEPVDPASVQPTDFVLQMANVDRTPASTTVSADGTRVTLEAAEPWEAAEAGLIRLAGPGAIADTSGNASLGPLQIRVGGAPGDFISPVITSFRLNPHRGVCFVLGPRCKRDRMAIIFRSSEDGDTYVTVYRGSRRIGERRYTGQPGANFIRFDGKILGRRLKPGRYRMFVAMQDEVGNRTPPENQPSTLFRVKSTRR